MRAFGTCISEINQEVARELPLDVEIPLLNVRRREVGQSCTVTVSLHVDQALVPAKGRSNSVGLIRQPRRIEGVDEQVVWCVIPAHVNRQEEHPVAQPDHRVLVQLVGGAYTRADMLPSWEWT